MQGYVTLVVRTSISTGIWNNINDLLFSSVFLIVSRFPDSVEWGFPDTCSCSSCPWIPRQGTPSACSELKKAKSNFILFGSYKWSWSINPQMWCDANRCSCTWGSPAWCRGNSYPDGCRWHLGNPDLQSWWCCDHSCWSTTENIAAVTNYTCRIDGNTCSPYRFPVVHDATVVIRHTQPVNFRRWVFLEVMLLSFFDVFRIDSHETVAVLPWLLMPEADRVPDLVLNYVFLSKQRIKLYLK